MDLSECIAFANANPVTYIATIEGDQPHVRAFAMWFADQTGFLLSHWNPKEHLFAALKEPEDGALFLCT